MSKDIVMFCGDWWIMIDGSLYRKAKSAEVELAMQDRQGAFLLAINSVEDTHGS